MQSLPDWRIRHRSMVGLIRTSLAKACRCLKYFVHLTAAAAQITWILRWGALFRVHIGASENSTPRYSVPASSEW